MSAHQDARDGRQDRREGRQDVRQDVQNTREHRADIRDVVVYFWLFVTTVVAAVAIAIALHGVHRNSSAFASIQQSRIDNCEAQNRRHHNTINALDSEISNIEHGTPASQRATVTASLNASKASTVSLIDALQPEQRCTMIVSPSP